MQKLKCYVLGHSDKSLESIPDCPWLVKTNLNELELPIPNTNEIAENRLFLADDSFFDWECEYIGTLTWQYDRKYCWALSLSDLDELLPELEEDVVFAPATNIMGEVRSEYAPSLKGIPRWVEHMQNIHGPSFQGYLDEISRVSGLPLVNEPCFWANNFICHREVFREFLRFFKKVFTEIHARHGYDFNFLAEDPPRKAAYLYESVAMIYFSNRFDLRIRQMPRRCNFMDQIAWFSSSSKGYEEVTQWHLKSLQLAGVMEENIFCVEYFTPDAITDSISFGSQSYQHCVSSKIYFYVRKLKQYRKSVARGERKHKFIVLTDCDVQAFGGRLKEWKRMFGEIEASDKTVHMCCQNSLLEANTGIIIFKAENLDRVIDWLEKIEGIMMRTPPSEMYLMDQTVINEQRQLMDWGWLHYRHVMLGPDFHPPQRHQYVLHHAIKTTTKQQKLDQLRHIKYLVTENRDTLFVYKNYKRSEELMLSVRSLRHFLPGAEVHCILLHDESPEEYSKYAEAFESLGVLCHHFAKAHKDQPSDDGREGCHVAEWINHAYRIFPSRSRVVLMEETNYFTSGETLSIIMDQDWDLVYGFTFAINHELKHVPKFPRSNMSKRMLAINFNLMRDSFPMPEVPDDARVLLGHYLYDRAYEMKARVISMRTRNHTNYEGDGTWTDNINEIKDHLAKSGIL